MPVSFLIWRVVVGLFNASKLSAHLSTSHPIDIPTYSPLPLFIIFLLLLANDVHPHPGPISNKTRHFSVSFWNANSISAHNFSKIDLVKSYNSIYKYDMICIAETFLDSSFLSNDERLHLDGYELIRSDHPNNVKRGGVCIYIKNSLAAMVCNITKLNECIVIETNLNNRKGYVVCLYRSPSQTNDEFDDFLIKFGNTLQDISSLNPAFLMVLGDFNAKSFSWYDKDITSNEGFEIESLTSFYGLTQLISDPTHILRNSSSCIDLIFIDKPNLVINSGVHSSLHPNCHHQIIYAEINFKIEFPPPYERIVWDYKNANAKYINLAIDGVNWERLFENKSINDQVKFLNDTLMNIFKNFIPNKILTFNDKDPPWINENVKHLIKIKNDILKLYFKNGRNANDFILLQNTNQQLSDLIKNSKDEYNNRLSLKLNNPKTSAKAYWTILKTLVNGKKTPLIPPLLVNGTLVTDFLQKANLFNSFFSEQCTTIPTNSKIPNNPTFISNKRLDKLVFNIDDIVKIIQNLNPCKAHGHDGISIKMVQLSCVSIAKPLFLIFKNCFNASTFPAEWKKSNVIPIHKKGDKKIISNYRPISLLPIFSKIFEKIIFNNLYNYMDENHFFNPNQSGFRQGDSCVHQLISITHNIYKSFDINPSQEVRGIFLDISKAFDRVWHKGLLYKIKNFGIDGKLFVLIQSFLSDRYQRVNLNGQSSDWSAVKAGVPQGSLLGPLLFLSYINDLPDGLLSNVKLFADDTALFSTVLSPRETTNELKHDLAKIKDWAVQWKMLFNPDHNKPAKEVIFSRKINKDNHPPIFFNNTPIKTCSNETHLGLTLDEKLDFKCHTQEKINKAMRGVGIIRKLSLFLPRFSLLTIYKSFVRPHLDYGDVIYDQLNNQCISDRIESVQYNAALAITGAIRGTSRIKIYKELGLESLKDRRWTRRLCYFYKIFHSQSPSYLFDHLPSLSMSERFPNRFNSFYCRTNAFKNSFFPYTFTEWNKLDVHTRTCTSYPVFRKHQLKLIRPQENSIFNIYDPLGIKLLTRLRLDFSHLKEHKFRHNFNDSLNPMCACSLEPESTLHFLLHCHYYDNIRLSLMSELHSIDASISLLDDTNLVNLLLFGDKKYDLNTNRSILYSTISFIKKSLRFDGPLF